MKLKGYSARKTPERRNGDHVRRNGNGYNTSGQLPTMLDIGSAIQREQAIVWGMTGEELTAYMVGRNITIGPEDLPDWMIRHVVADMVAMQMTGGGC